MHKLNINNVYLAELTGIDEAAAPTVDSIVEARPSRARFKLGVRAEKIAFTAFAEVISGFFVVDVFTREGRFGTTFAAHVILFGSEFFHPIFVSKFFLFGPNRRGNAESVPGLFQLSRMTRHGAQRRHTGFDGR